MRVLRLPTLVVAFLLGAGVAGCSTSIEGSGTLAEGVVTAGPGPTGTDSPTQSPTATETSSSPTPTAAPSPTTDPITLRRRVLCVTEQASIASVNSRFNKAKSRDAQVAVLRSGATSISGQLSRSGLPRADRIYAAGAGVLAQLNRLVQAAGSGGTPSTNPYNVATKAFQKACTGI